MNKPYIIGIAGGSGAGKTFFLKSLRAHFDESELCIVSQDNYYLAASEQLIDENGELNFDRPEGIDAHGFLKDIGLLSTNQTVIRKEYVFNQKGIIGENIKLDPAPVIIVEGLFIFYFKEIRNILDLKIFMDAPHETRLERRLTRDQKERGLSHETIHYQWNNHVIPAFDAYLLPYKNEADLIIENNGAIGEAIDKLVKTIRNKTGIKPE